MTLSKNIFVLLSILLITTIGSSQNSGQPLTRILFVFDASQSMYGQWNNETKIAVARKQLISLIDSLEKVPNTQLALRVYGHQSPVPPQDCNDTKLEVPFAPNNAGMIRQKLRWVDPKGTTPIARSLELAARDFPVANNTRNIIILITDGIEACDGDPCAVSKALQERGVTLKPFIIGIGLDVDFIQTFKCVGRVFNAKTENQFKEVLSVAISSALNSTTAQVNLLDSKGRPTESDVNMTFYDNVSGKIKYNYIHTINHRGNPDTLVLDPLITYDMLVHTIPSVSLDNIELVPGKHNVFAVDAPQGYLELKHPGGQLQDLKFRITRPYSRSTLNVQDAGKVEKYICGKYDVEIFTLPRINLKGVQISQSQTTTLRIPQPGQVTLMKNTPGYGGIYVEKDNELEMVVTLDYKNKSSETYILQPGKYRVVYRPVNVKESIYTVEKEFEIKSGTAEHIRLY